MVWKVVFLVFIVSFASEGCAVEVFLGEGRVLGSRFFPGNF